MKKGDGSGVSPRYGTWDPDPHQNVTDPQHWIEAAWQCTLDPDMLVQIWSTDLNSPLRSPNPRIRNPTYRYLHGSESESQIRIRNNRT